MARSYAACALWGTYEAWPQLIAALDDPDASVRYLALVSLLPALDEGLCSGPYVPRAYRAALLPIERYLKREVDHPHAQRTAISAIRGRSLHGVAVVLSDPNSEIRAAALRAIRSYLFFHGEIGEPLPTVIGLLDDDSPEVRREAIEILSEVDLPSICNTLPKMIRLAGNDPDVGVRNTAYGIVRRLTRRAQENDQVLWEALPLAFWQESVSLASFLLAWLVVLRRSRGRPHERRRAWIYGLALGVPLTGVFGFYFYVYSLTLDLNLGWFLPASPLATVRPEVAIGVTLSCCVILGVLWALRRPSRLVGADLASARACGDLSTPDLPRSVRTEALSPSLGPSA